MRHPSRCSKAAKDDLAERARLNRESARPVAAGAQPDGLPRAAPAAFHLDHDGVVLSRRRPGGVRGSGVSRMEPSLPSLADPAGTLWYRD